MDRKKKSAPPARPESAAHAALRSGRRVAYRPPEPAPPPGRHHVEEEDAPITPRPRVQLGDVPRVVARVSGLDGLPIDHRMGFVLGLVDGRTSVETMIDISGMQKPEVLAIVEHLLVLGVIAV